MTLKFGMHKPSGLLTIDAAGEPRVLACLKDPARGLYANPLFKNRNSNSGFRSIVPESDWVDCSDVKEGWVPDRYDQNGQGCLTDDAEVLTDEGWLKWTNVQGTERLGTVNPVTKALEFQRPTALHTYEYDGEIVNSTNRRLNFSVTPQHRMWARKWDESKRNLSQDYAFQEAQNIGWYAGMLAAPESWVGVKLGTVTVDPNLPQMSGDDFVTFCALIASDGWAGGTENTKNRVSFCCFDERLESSRALAHRIGFAEQPGRPGVFYRSSPILANWIRAEMYSGPVLGAPNKRVPQIIKSLDAEQIERFLLAFGDRHGDQYYSSSKDLIDGIQELLLRTGRRGSIGQRDTRMTDGRAVSGRGPQYTLTASTTDRLCIERKKHIESSHYKGTVFCATVPNGLLVTRQNDSVLISGNSCVGHGAAGAFGSLWAKTGNAKQRFSPCYLYSLINGGRDNGAIPADALDALRTKGVCLETTVGPKHIYPSQFDKAAADAEASRFRVSEAFVLRNFREMMSAVQLQEFGVAFGIDLGQSFEPDSDGVIPRLRGSGGGHMMYASGAKKIGSTWYLEITNSWSENWGNKGVCYMEASYFDNDGLDAWCIQAAPTDPKEGK